MKWVHQKRLIVVTSAAALRDQGAYISKDISWERSAQDVAVALRKNKAFSDLAECQRVIVSFGPTGALLIEGDNDKTKRYTLIFNKDSTEGQWGEDRSDGMMIGYGSALCAAIVRELVVSDSAEPCLIGGIKHGLEAMNRIHYLGFRAEGIHGERIESPVEYAARPVFNGVIGKGEKGLKANVEREARDELAGIEKLKFSVAYMPTPVISPEKEETDGAYPSIASAMYGREHGRQHALAMEIAVKGKDVIDNVPVATFENLVTVDRQEIEGLRSIRNLISSYADRDRNKKSLGRKPQSIAVFGPPGSGKGYAIGQIKESLPINVKENLEQIEFNLAQLRREDLVGALHRVRDVALGGHIPLVLWDEFDSPQEEEELGWLRYFLTPMQEGKFQQGEADHRIGEAIFVFAGGTCSRFEDFNDQANNAAPAAKAPDFVSRLRGYINIADVNPSNDSTHMIRRALILNQFFHEKKVARKTPKADDLDESQYDVDRALIHAFLNGGNYKHGVRSMKAIVDMSRLMEGESYRISSLPSQAQLDLHVGGANFIHTAHEYSVHNHHHEDDEGETSPNKDLGSA